MDICDRLYWNYRGSGLIRLLFWSTVIADKSIFGYNIWWFIVQFYQKSKLFIDKGPWLMKSNFECLGQYRPALAAIGKTAENYLYTDAIATFISLVCSGMGSEGDLCRLAAAISGDWRFAGGEDPNTKKRTFPSNIEGILLVLCKRRNDAVYADGN